MRNFRVRNVRLVSGIEQQKRVMFARVGDPMRELRARCHSPGRIVRKTKIDQIDMFLWRLGNKIIFRRAWQIHEAFIAAVLPTGPRVPSHHICVDIDRINRIGDGDLVLVAENVEDVAAIAFRTVRDKNFVVGDLNVVFAIIVLCNFGSKKFVTLFRAIAAKCLAMTQLLDCALHCFNCRARERLRDVTNPAPN